MTKVTTLERLGIKIFADGADIAATEDLLRKAPLVGKDLGQSSLETVRVFHDDARAASVCL